MHFSFSAFHENPDGHLIHLPLNKKVPSGHYLFTVGVVTISVVSSSLDDPKTLKSHPKSPNKRRVSKRQSNNQHHHGHPPLVLLA